MAASNASTGLCAALLSLLAIPSAASAAKNPYTAPGVCGAGYKVIDRHRMHATDPSNGNPVLLATVVLTYNPARGMNCAVTMKLLLPANFEPRGLPQLRAQERLGALPADRGRGTRGAVADLPLFGIGAATRAGVADQVI